MMGINTTDIRAASILELVESGDSNKSDSCYLN